MDDGVVGYMGGWVAVLGDPPVRAPQLPRQILDLDGQSPLFPAARVQHDLNRAYTSVAPSASASLHVHEYRTKVNSIL